MNPQIREHLKSAIISAIAVAVLAITPIIPGMTWSEAGLITLGMVALRAVGKELWAIAVKWAIQNRQSDSQD